MPRVAVPNIKAIAPTGHAFSHAPWPMQRVGSISVALPLIKPSTSPSGQARTHAEQPMQVAVSTTGWSELGSVSPASRASSWIDEWRASVARRWTT